MGRAVFLQQGNMRAIPHKTNNYPSRDLCYTKHITRLLI